MAKRLAVVSRHVSRGQGTPMTIEPHLCAGFLSDPVIQVSANKDLTGKTVLVTGGNSGVGYEAARQMAGMGAEVIITSRSETRARRAADSFGGTGMALDLAHLEGVRQFAKVLAAHFAELPLHVLILNAGMVYDPNFRGPYLTAEGLDPLIASNYFGHWLLVRLLRPILERSHTRIVLVSSITHGLVGRDFVMPQFPLAKDGQAVPSLKGMQWYAASKLQTLMFAYKLQRELAATGVTTVACTPGAVKTSIGTDDRSTGDGPLKRLPLMEPSEGAKPLIAAALVDEAPLGKLVCPYWVWDRLSSILPARVHGWTMFGFEAIGQRFTWGPIRAHNTSLESQDLSLQDALWDWTAGQIGALA